MAQAQGGTSISPSLAQRQVDIERTNTLPLVNTLMHQTDATGRALNTALPIVQQQQQQQKKGSASDVFYRIFCCFPTPDAASAVSNRMRMPLLPAMHPEDSHKKCLVLDLDETLVHSSFKEIPNPDFVIPVEIDGTVHRV
jgi:hypothetical protein